MICYVTRTLLGNYNILSPHWANLPSLSHFLQVKERRLMNCQSHLGSECQAETQILNSLIWLYSWSYCLFHCSLSIATCPIPLPTQVSHPVSHSFTLTHVCTYTPCPMTWSVSWRISNSAFRSLPGLSISAHLAFCLFVCFVFSL